jgi:hypothetical protein
MYAFLIATLHVEDDPHAATGSLHTMTRGRRKVAFFSGERKIFKGDEGGNG